MGILIADNFNYKGKKPLDERIVYDLLSDMKAVADSIIYEGAIAYCKEDKKFYTFDPANIVDATTGKWRKLQLGGTGNASIEDYTQDTQYKKNGLLLYNNKIYLVTKDFTSDNTQTLLEDSFNLDLTASNFVPVDTDTNCVEYIQNKEYKKDTLVYNNEVLARVILDFTSDNTATNIKDSFELDITNNNLVVVSGNVKVLDRIKTSNFLSVNVGSTSQIPVSTLSETDITKLKENQIVFDSNGAVGYISSIDTTNSQIGVTTMTVVGGSQLTRLLSNEELNKTILGNTTLEYTDLVTSLTVNELVENLLVYDSDGTVAKIDSISTNTTSGITTIVTTTLTTSADDSFDMKYYRYNNALDKTVDTTHNILFSDLSVTATTTINDLQVEQIVFDGDGTVSKIENIDTVNGEVTVRIISSGITNTPIKEYKTTETLSQIIDSQQVINVPAGLNVNDIEIDQLVYDQEGTVARIVGIDTTANTLTVQIMTGLGMPTAPDHKKPTIKNGGSGYAVNDIVETTTSGIFVKVTAVDTNGIITDVLYDNTATAASTSGTKAIIDYDQVIYGGYGKNWYELQGASVLVAQTVAEGFTYIQGYEYSIDNAGTGYAIDDTIATNVTDQYVRVTDVDVNGEILSVEYTRDTTVNTSGSSATITATSSTNVFIVPDDRWNTGTALFTITNDDGASVQFLRTDPITTKYNAGASGKIYKFVYNPINGAIIQSFAQMSGGSATEVPGVTFEENHAYKKGDLIVRNNKMYVCNGDYTSTNDFDTDLANGDWQLYEVMEIGGEIV